MVEKKYLVFAGLLVASVVLSSYFLSASGLLLSDFFEFRLEEIRQNAMSLNFILFLATAPIALAAIVAFSRKFEKKEKKGKD